ncbi:MAG: hypothetical protein ACKVX7_08180 [Planctomycetota bacterium]
MRLHLSKGALLSTVLITAMFAGSSTASAWTPTGDCTGWSLYQEFIPGELHGTVSLECWNGASWVTIETQPVHIIAPTGIYSASGAWTVTGSGECRVLLVAENFIAGIGGGVFERVSDSTFICDGPPPPPPPPGVAPRTPGYWKNHDWPVGSLSLGGFTYSRDCLIQVLGLPTVGDARIKLIHHLIAAKLNLIAGSADSVVDYPTDGDTVADVISAADTYLAGELGGSCPSILVGAAPGGSEKAYVNGLKDVLDDYNNGLFD